MLDNPKVDKKMMLQMFLNQVQMSGELPGYMNKELQQLQRSLKNEENFTNNDADYGVTYNMGNQKNKHISYLDGDNKEEGVDEYADLIDRIDRPSPAKTVDIEQIELQEASRSSSRQKGQKSRPSTALTASSNNRGTSTSYTRLRKKDNTSRLNYMSLNQGKDKSGSSLRSLAGTSTGYQTVKPTKKLKTTTTTHKDQIGEPRQNKENDSKNGSDPKIAKAKKTVIKRRDHNYSTSSTQIPTSSVV